MAKGSTAKVNVQNKIAMAFGADYIGEQDKKIYVWADDGGERVQIAIAMTCPKTPIAAENEAAHTAWDWSEDTPTTPIRGQRAEVMKSKVEITQEEQDKIADMIQRFGL